MAQRRPSKKRGPQKSWEERLRLVRQIDEYRAAHPKDTVTEAIAALGLGITVKNYYPWRKLADQQPKADTEHHDTVEHFPLEVIPAKPVARARPANSQRPRHDEDKVLAASLLEIAARLLKR